MRECKFSKLAKANFKGADVVVFPEEWSVGYMNYLNYSVGLGLR